MKQRITYVVKDPDAFSPEQLKVVKQNGNSPASFTFDMDPSDSVKEHRITMGLDELPEEFQKLFQQWHKFHARLTLGYWHLDTPPFTSHISTGLNVFFTPLDSQPDADFCHMLHRLFWKGMKCNSTKEAAIKVPVHSEHSSTFPSMHYFSTPSAIGDDSSTPGYREILRHLRRKITPDDTSFDKWLYDTQSADYLDMDYDPISQTLVYTIYEGWRSGWPETIYLLDNESTIEIGVLSHEPNSDPEDIQFGGFLTVLGRDEKPKPTRFQTPTRHYPHLVPEPYSPTQTPKRHPLQFRMRHERERGLHPNLLLEFDRQNVIPPEPTCKLHAYFTLPSAFFIDRYQLNDPLFLSSNNLKALHSLAGATDLEAPDWVMKQWGSTALFELALPELEHPELANESPQRPTDQWQVTIPLHSRYQPADTSFQTDIEYPLPSVFWACHSDAGPLMAGNPFDRVHLGYDALFGLQTRFIHVQAANHKSDTMRYSGHIGVPTLEWEESEWVEVGTLGTIVVAFLGLCWVLFRKRGGSERQGPVEVKKTQ